jgi:hypothetical protein
MVVGDDQLDAFETAADQTVEEGAPMDLRLGQGHRHAQHPAMTIPGDANRHQHGAVNQPSAFAHPLVAGIEKDIGCFVQRPLTPDGKAASSCSAARLTCVEEIETSGPSSLTRMSVTFRVETPCTYISAKAMLSACSVRVPFSSALG